MDYRRLLSPTGTTLHVLEKRLYQELKPFRSRLHGKSLLIAVSGGLDSMSLLYLLSALQTRFSWKLKVAHFNHGVRGRCSDKDALFVKKLSQKLKLKFVSAKLRNVKKKRMSENTLRVARYKFLSQKKLKAKCDFIVTAHHRDDLLETRLMRLLQGTGPSGLKSMGVFSNHDIFRPLLKFSRRELEIYAKDKRIKWREDQTNKDVKKLRNWIRHCWLNLLMTDHPQYAENLEKSLNRLVCFLDEEKSHTPHKSLARTSQASDQMVFSFLRQFVRRRLTSRDIAEFKKRLSSPKPQFEFRLGGVNWRVNSASISPSDP